MECEATAVARSPRDGTAGEINHDVVVPRGRVPQLLDVVGALAREYRLRVASFGHAGDGNIHVNFMVNKEDADELKRARKAERDLFERVVGLEGSISGEHGIGFAKAAYLPLELWAEEIALMKRVKAAFDPAGILNPGKIFPGEWMVVGGWWLFRVRGSWFDELQRLRFRESLRRTAQGLVTESSGIWRGLALAP